MPTDAHDAEHEDPVVWKASLAPLAYRHRDHWSEERAAPLWPAQLETAGRVQASESVAVAIGLHIRTAFDESFGPIIRPMVERVTSSLYRHFAERSKGRDRQMSVLSSLLSKAGGSNQGIDADSLLE